VSGFRLKGLLSHFFRFRSTFKSIKIIPFGLVQSKLVQSKPASLGPGPVRPSGETGPDQALPQTGSVQTGGIIGPDWWERLPLSNTCKYGEKQLMKDTYPARGAQCRRK